MSTWYVCIDNSYITSGNGTINFPYKYSQFLNWDGTNGSNFQNDDIINISGVQNSTGAYDFLTWTSIPTYVKNLTIQSWDIKNPAVFDINSGDIWWSLNDIDNLTLNFQHIIYKNFHLYFNNSSIVKNTFNFNNMILTNNIYLSDFFNKELSSTSYNINGCTFFNANVILEDSYTTSSRDTSAIFNFNDNVFINSKVYANDAEKNGLTKVNFNYCVFSGTSASNLSGLPISALNISASTFDWTTSTTFPDISAISPLNKGNLSFESFGLDYSFTQRRPFWLTSATSAGAFDTKRRGPGCFTFTNNIFYVDLSAITTSGTGTSSNPIEGKIFSAYNNFYNDDIIKLRGELILSGGNNLWVNFCGASGISMDAWNVSTYGPWRLILNGDPTLIGTFGFGFANNLFLKNGIIYLRDSNPYLRSTFNIPANSLENMFIQVSGIDDSDILPKILLNQSGNRLTIRGSTIILESDVYLSLSTSPSDNISLAARDCIFNIGAFSGDAVSTSAIFDNCVFDAANNNILKGSIFSATNQIQNNNCQYGWNPPTWPDMINNLSKEQMSFSTLTSGSHNITISGSNNW